MTAGNSRPPDGGRTETIVLVTTNLLDAAWVEEAASALGARLLIATPRDAGPIVDREQPRLVVLDLVTEGALDLLRRPEVTRNPTLGFYPHVQVELRQKALEAGIARALPRSAFFAALTRWLGGTDSAGGTSGLSERLPERDRD